MRKKQAYLTNPVNPFELVKIPARKEVLFRSKKTGKWAKPKRGYPSVSTFLKRKRKKHLRRNPLGELMVVNPNKRRNYMKRRHYRRSYRRYNRNPINLNGMMGGVVPLIKESSLIFVGYAGTSYVFNMLGSKIEILNKPIVKGVGSLLVASILEKKNKPLALGMAMAGIKNVLTIVAPQIVGQLASFEGYLPNTDSIIAGYLPNTDSPISSSLLSAGEIEEDF
ncbi:MAG: hypothetical protein GYA62_04185 [Bacteroidales bacterium]|nr:hypothetical protein [Bacteroidales bacterium]